MSYPKYGEVYYITPAKQVVGSEQRAGRPGIIVSNNVGNKSSSIVEVVFITAQSKDNLPTHVKIPAIGKLVESVALCEQINTISQTRLSDKLCILGDEEMAKIQAAMMVSLNMTPAADIGQQYIVQERKILELEKEVEIYKGVYLETIKTLRH